MNNEEELVSMRAQMMRSEEDLALLKVQMRISDEAFDFHLKRANALMERVNKLEAVNAQLREFIEFEADVKCNCAFDLGHQPTCRIVKARDLIQPKC